MGGAVGGVAVIVMAAVGVFFLRRPRSQAPSAAYRVDPAPQPRYESQNPFSDDGTHVSPLMTASETTTVPMRLYVIVPVSSLSPMHAHCFCMCTGPERLDHVSGVPRSSGCIRHPCPVAHLTV